MPLLKLGVLASHNGTTLQAVLDACAGGDLQAEVAVVISNNADSGALQRATQAGVPTHHISDANAGGETARNLAICDCLLQHDAGLVLLAGYMKRLGNEVLQAFPHRIVNTHPSLLPKFGGQGMYGSRVYEAVIRSGEKQTGVTLHLVNSQYDRGAVIASQSVAVQPEDDAASLAARVQQCERQFVVQQLKQLSNDLSQLDKIGG